jgi:NADPH:quinone reductase-like Zn-dependent oxidoreductase
MKAVLFTQYGKPDKLVVAEVDKPAPVDTQVLVRVMAASINASDWRAFENPILARLVGENLTKPKDQRTGSDVAGIVEAVGENVTQFKPGDEVFGDGKGAFAEYVLAREANLVPKPANVSFEQAAAVPVAAITALQAIRYAGGIRPGQKVAVQGASGGVGLFTLQLAKFYGAEVTAICSPKSLDLVLSSGADHVVDYTRQDFTKNRQAYDLIFAVNGYHSLWAYKRALAPGGQYVCVGGSLRQIIQSFALGRLMSRSADKKLSNMGIAKLNPLDLQQLAELLASGRITPVIDCTYPLSQTAEAFKYVLETHPRGKVVISLADDKPTAR